MANYFDNRLTVSVIFQSKQLNILYYTDFGLLVRQENNLKESLWALENCDEQIFDILQTNLSTFKRFPVNMSSSIS